MRIEGKDAAGGAGVRFPPPLAFLGTLLAGLAIGRVIGHPGIPIGGWTERVLGSFGIVAGGAILLTAIGLFKKAGTHTRPWMPSSTFVTDGVYRWTRNPMYLGMALAYAGAAVWLDSLTALLLLIPLVFVIQREVIEREEAYLANRFGEPYLAYKASVRRWV